MADPRPLRPLPAPPVPPPARRSSASIADGVSSSSNISQATLNPRVCPACNGRYPADFRVCPRDATPLEDAPDDEDPLLGQVLAGSYEVIRVIGEGGMGKVYEARHSRLHNKRFAVKVLHQELSRQPEVVTRFQREAEAASVLTHPNVVGVFDVNVSQDGSPYIVAELLEGEELGNYLDRVGKLPAPEAARVVRQICRALAAAHAQGIVHRDVKPENVFLVGQGATVKVLDFGISKVGESQGLTQTGTVMGTPDYMAPEQARGDRVDARADIYAAGAILYRALTGRKPFQGLDPMAVLTAVLTQEPPRPSTIDEEIPLALELIVQRAMSKTPAERYQTMDELDRELAAFDTGESAPSIVVTATHEPATSETATARTVLTSSAQAAAVRDSADASRGARLARPGLVFFTGLGLLWAYVNVVVAGASFLRVLRGNADITSSEVALTLIGAGAAIVSPAVLWIRHIAKQVWPSTPRALETMSRLRRTMLYSASAYGLAGIVVYLFEVVVQRHGAGVARPGWSLFVFQVGLLAAVITWIATKPRRKKA